MVESICLYSYFSKVLAMALCKNIVNQYIIVQKSLSLCMCAYREREREREREVWHAHRFEQRQETIFNLPTWDVHAYCLFSLQSISSHFYLTAFQYVKLTSVSNLNTLHCILITSDFLLIVWKNPAKGHAHVFYAPPSAWKIEHNGQGLPSSSTPIFRTNCLSS